MPQAWTLGLELTFYLLAPFLVKISTRKLLVILLVLSSTKYLIAGIYLQLGDPVSYRFLPFEIQFFIGGILLFRYWKRFIKSKSTKIIHDSKTNFSLVIVLIVIYLCAPWFINLQQNNIWAEWIAPLILVTCISALVPFLFELTRNIKWDGNIGKYSYPIYLVHFLVLSLLFEVPGKIFGLNTQEGLFGFSLLALVLFISSWLLVRVSNRIDILRDRFRPK